MEGERGCRLGRSYSKHNNTRKVEVEASPHAGLCGVTRGGRGPSPQVNCRHDWNFQVAGTLFLRRSIFPTNVIEGHRVWNESMTM
jgi:hypothetical protein